MTDTTKGKDPLEIKNLPTRDAKEAGDVKGGRPMVSGTGASTTVCATGPKSEDCVC